MEFGKRLTELRKARKLNQKECADDLRKVFGEPVETSKYNKWENGKNNPDYDAVCKLAQYFNTSTDYLLGATNIRDSIDDIASGFFSSSGYIGSLKNLESEMRMADISFLENAVSITNSVTRSLSLIRQARGSVNMSFNSMEKRYYCKLLSTLKALNVVTHGGINSFNDFNILINDYCNDELLKSE